MSAKLNSTRDHAALFIFLFCCIFTGSAVGMNLFQQATRGVDLNKLPSESTSVTQSTPFDADAVAKRAGKRWLRVLTGDDYVVLLDIKSMQGAKGNGHAKAWTLWIYQEPKQLSSGKRYYSNAQLNYYNCRNRTSGIKQIIFRGSQTQDTPPIHTISFSDPEVEMTDPPPESNGEYLLELVCD